MISPGFHSTGFLAHLSGLWVAIRKACRHFSFFCVSTQFVMLCVSICSSVSLALILMYSIQSSSLGHTHRLCCLVLAYLHSFRHFGCFFPLSHFSLCLNDGTKHSVLGNAEHLFVFFTVFASNTFPPHATPSRGSKDHQRSACRTHPGQRRAASSLHCAEAHERGSQTGHRSTFHVDAHTFESSSPNLFRQMKPRDGTQRGSQRFNPTSRRGATRIYTRI